MRRGTKVKYWWGKELRIGSFIKQNGAYFYFRAGPERGNIVELYQNEFKILGKHC